MATRFHFCWPLATSMVFAVACGSGDKTQPPPFQQATSNLTRNITPQVSAADAQKLVEGNTAFAVDFFKTVRNPGNMIVSPYSVSLALAMTYAGAKDQTATAMAQTLHFDLAPEQLHPAFDQLDLLLSSRGQNAKGKDDQHFRLKIANSIWGQTGYQFVPAFLDTLAVNYGAGLNLLDFVMAPDQSRSTINDWVAKKTEDRIKDLLGPGSVTADTRLVLTNAIYFNAAWEKKFEAATGNEPFVLADSRSVQVPTMHSSETAKAFAESETWTAAELPYDGHEISMVVVLPKTGTLDAFENQLDSTQVQTIFSSLSAYPVRLSMPRFKLDFKSSLRKALSMLGMDVAFTAGAANFTGINAQGNLYISDVIHQATATVDESGTEAAAATAVIVNVTAVLVNRELILNRPFLFFIRDMQTGAVLFMGHVVDPR